MKKNWKNTKINKNRSITEYYLDSFIVINKEFISGKCLVIIDDDSLISLVKRNISDCDLNILVLDEVSLTSKFKKIRNGSYDCVIVINILNNFGDYNAIIKECLRVLKLGGAFLTTLSSIALSKNPSKAVWGFTEASAAYIFSRYFNQKKLLVKGYGNVLAGRFLLDEVSANKLSFAQLNYYDPYFPLSIGVRAIKSRGKSE